MTGSSTSSLTRTCSKPKRRSVFSGVLRPASNSRKQKDTGPTPCFVTAVRINRNGVADPVRDGVFTPSPRLNVAVYRVIATVQKVYDNLDFQRAVQAYLLGLSAVSTEAARQAVLAFGPANQTVLISETLLDSKSLFLTANTTTPYTVMWLDLTKGPVVLEVPPMVLGPLDDAWFRWVTDVGFTGPDKGKGGKYLLLPPGYTGEHSRRLLCRTFAAPMVTSFSSARF